MEHEAILAGVTATVPDVAAVLNMSVGGLYQAIKRGEVPATRIGGKVLVLCAPLRRQLGLVEATKTQAAA